MGSKNLKIQSFVSCVDWFSFNQIYAAIASPEAIRLYMNLFFQKQVNDQLEVFSYDLNRFLKNYGLNEKEFIDLLVELEQLDLAKLYVQNGANSKTLFIVKIEEVKNLKTAVKDEKIKHKLYKFVPQEKLSELMLLSEETNYGYHVNLNDSQTLINQTEETQDNILDEETYCNFYNGIFRNLNSEFSLCDQVLKMVKEYCIIEKKLSMEQLQNFSYLSIKEKNGKFVVSPEHLSFLINKEINKSNDSSFKEREYDEFWRELLIMPDQEIENKFNDLFSKYDSEDIYMLLTSKPKAPATLNKWIKDCIQNKNLNFPILNASISFVKTLLKKIPINYLIKLTDTLINNGITEKREFIDHIKKVIIHDSENQNRINAKTESVDEFNSIKMSQDEPCFFTKKSDF